MFSAEVQCCFTLSSKQSVSEQLSELHRPNSRIDPNSNLANTAHWIH